MSWMPLTHHEPKSPPSGIPTWLRAVGFVLRLIFIACLVLVTIRVSMPQSETIWTAYDSPGDLVRMALGLAVCIWIVVQLFKAPKDAQAYRTWVYFGLAAVPFALICVFFVW